MSTEQSMKFALETIAAGECTDPAAMARVALEPEVADNTKVICPNCVHQFRAIPVQVQQLMLSVGLEPPFAG